MLNDQVIVNGKIWAQWREIGYNDSLRELEWLEASLATGVEDGIEETLDLGFHARLLGLR